MRKVLPTEKFTITTHLESHKVQVQLLNFVEPYKSRRTFFIFAPPNKPYEGTVKDGFFKIQKLSTNRVKNNLPIIEGRISPQDRGSIIDVTIKPDESYNLITSFFTFLFITIAVIAGLSLLIYDDIDTINDKILILLAPISITIGPLIEIKKFQSNMKKDKQFLLKIFK